MRLLRNKLADFASAKAALVDLVAPFAPAGMALECEEVQPASMPGVIRRLLAHREHMTVVLSEHFGAPVDVHVQHHVHDGNFYARQIILTPGGSNRTVLVGIVRMNFRYMGDDVRDEIVARRRPLGEILIAHDVLRWIEPLWFVRFPPVSPLLALFDLAPKEPTFGRLATIYCNGEPAIELLEAVLNV